MASRLLEVAVHKIHPGRQRAIAIDSRRTAAFKATEPLLGGRLGRWSVWTMVRCGGRYWQVASDRTKENYADLRRLFLDCLAPEQPATGLSKEDADRVKRVRTAVQVFLSPSDPRVNE